MFSRRSIPLLAFTLFSLGISAQQPHFVESDVFVSGRDGINTYRIPSIVCTKEGTLLAFSEGRQINAADGTPTNIVLKRGFSKGEDRNLRSGGSSPSISWHTTWLPMQTVIRSIHGEAYMNPVPLIDGSTGAIFLLVNYYPQPYADLPAEIWLLVSRNEGVNWTPAVNITSAIGKHELGPGTGIQLKSGRLMAAVYDGVIFSDDHGKTWKASNRALGKPNETQVAELVDGTLVLNRRDKRYRQILTSKDSGLTWSPPVPDPHLPDADCQGSLIRYTRKDTRKSKNRLLFSNPVAGLPPDSIKESDPRGRFNITMRLSYDEGKSWPIAKVMRNGPGAYSSITILPDGSIGVLYEYGDRHNEYFNHYQKLVFARFNLEWLTDGKDHLEEK